MKTIKAVVIAILCMGSQGVIAQNDSEIIKKSFTVGENSKTFWLCVCNIYGNVSVEAYDGNTIEMEVEKLVYGRSDADVQQGMEELQVGVSQGREYLRLRMEAPFNRYREKDDPLECGWEWNNREDRRDYWYRFHYKVKVPEKISVKISTVNKGDLYIKGVQGEIYANNVNGDVELTGIADNTKAHTVNGKIEVRYTRLPSEFAEFETVNGDIEVFAPKDARGVYNFDTQWGEVYSEFDFTKKLAPKMVSAKNKRGGTLYKIANSNSYQIGNGGPSFGFKTLNGDILIRKDQ